MHVCVETGLCVCECVWRLGCVCVVMHMWRDAVCVEGEVCVCVCVCVERQRCERAWGDRAVGSWSDSVCVDGEPRV